MRAFLQRFIYGRYGCDQLNWFLLALYLLCYLLSLIFAPLYFIGFICLLFSIFRTLSRNLSRRRAENARFLQAAGPAIRWWKLRCTMAQDKEHRYFKCPNCRQQLRVPKGKGKLNITCRNCGVCFEKTT